MLQNSRPEPISVLSREWKPCKQMFFLACDERYAIFENFQLKLLVSKIMFYSRIHYFDKAALPDEVAPREGNRQSLISARAGTNCRPGVSAKMYSASVLFFVTFPILASGADNNGRSDSNCFTNPLWVLWSKASYFTQKLKMKNETESMPELLLLQYKTSSNNIQIPLTLLIERSYLSQLVSTRRWNRKWFAKRPSFKVWN